MNSVFAYRLGLISIELKLSILKKSFTLEALSTYINLPMSSFVKADLTLVTYLYDHNIGCK